MAGLVPAIHVFLFLTKRKTWIPAFAGMTKKKKTWMPGARPGMTMKGEQAGDDEKENSGMTKKEKNT